MFRTVIEKLSTKRAGFLLILILAFTPYSLSAQVQELTGSIDDLDLKNGKIKFKLSGGSGKVVDIIAATPKWPQPSLSGIPWPPPFVTGYSVAGAEVDSSALHFGMTAMIKALPCTDLVPVAPLCAFNVKADYLNASGSFKSLDSHANKFSLTNRHEFFGTLGSNPYWPLSANTSVRIARMLPRACLDMLKPGMEVNVDYVQCTSKSTSMCAAKVSVDFDYVHEEVFMEYKGVISRLLPHVKSIDLAVDSKCPDMSPLQLWETGQPTFRNSWHGDPASYTIDGKPASYDDLREGMRVEVRFIVGFIEHLNAPSGADPWQYGHWIRSVKAKSQ